MYCKKIRELIITDFIDQELSPRLNKKVLYHLESCIKCREFEQQVRNSAKDVFKKTGQINPPEYIWHRIKESIEKKEQSIIPETGTLLDRLLRNILTFPKPVFAVVTLAVVIVISLAVMKLPVRNQDIVSVYLSEQMQFSGYLNGEGQSYYDSGSIDLGTSIEEYLL